MKKFSILALSVTIERKISQLSNTTRRVMSLTSATLAIPELSLLPYGVRAVNTGIISNFYERDVTYERQNYKRITRA